MREVRLDASNWRTWEDLWNGLFEALGSPAWHGDNLNALIDSVIIGGINRVEAPYRLVFTGAKALPAEARTALTTVTEVLADEGARTRTLPDGTVEIDVPAARIMRPPATE